MFTKYRTDLHSCHLEFHEEEKQTSKHEKHSCVPTGVTQWSSRAPAGTGLGQEKPRQDVLNGIFPYKVLEF